MVAVGITVGLNDSVRHQLSLSFIPQPSDYTELYFATGRPVEVTPHAATMTVTVQFTIVNHEGHTAVYPYAVEVADQVGIPVARADGSMTIPNSDSLTREVAVTLPISTSWTAVNVNLHGRAERLHLLQSEWTTLLNQSGSLSRGAVEGTHGMAPGVGEAVMRS